MVWSAAPLIWRRGIVGWLAAAVIVAAEPPPVPDPFGLGERLALLDHLREHYRLQPSPEADLPALRAAYAAAWRSAQGQDEALLAAAEERDRLRRRIEDRFHRVVPVETGVEDLRALLAQLESEKAVADAAAIAARLREAPPPRTDAPRPPSPPPVRADTAEPAAPVPAVPRQQVRDLMFDAEGVAACRLFVQERPLLGVQFGAERAGEFRGVFEYLAATLAKGRGPASAIVLLGHGSGTTIAGEPIDDHLRRWKAFYETFGGTRPAAPVECLVIASCSRGSAVQMSEMRDGLGYYPIWRVATADRTYANAPSVLAAFTGVVQATSEDRPFRGIYRWGKGEDSPASVAEMGRDGARGGLRYFDVTVVDQRLVITER